MNTEPNSPSWLSPQEIGDEGHDFSLRPDKFSEYIGQNRIKEHLHISIQAARQRQEPLDHVLLYGPPGLGKTTLAHLVAKEMNGNLKVTSGPIITKAGDLAALLSGLAEGDFLFIDEIHRLPRTVEEILYPAMEDGVLDIMLGKGPTARSLRLTLPRFTLVGATTKAGSLSQPLRDRFGHIHRLDYYDQEDLIEILRLNGERLAMDITPDALDYLATRARKTPRVANRLLKRIRDFASVKNHPRISADVAEIGLSHLAIDSHGLDATDHLILTTVERQFDGKPVGLQTLAAATGEEAETIEDVIEPYLLRIGFLARTPRGRVLTDLARTHLGFSKTIR